MVKADSLQEFRPTVRYKDGSSVSLMKIRDMIKASMEEIGAPVALMIDKVKFGFFNPSYEDCIVMYHPEHEYDYFNFCIRVTRQGSYAFVSVEEFGQSDQMDKAEQVEFARQDRKGKNLGYKIGSVIGSGIAGYGRNKQKLEAEMQYYQCVFDVFDEVIA